MKLVMGALGLVLIYLAASGKLTAVVETLIGRGGPSGTASSASKAAQTAAPTQSVLTPRR